MLLLLLTLLSSTSYFAPSMIFKGSFLEQQHRKSPNIKTTNAMAKRADTIKRPGGNPTTYRSQKVINSPYTTTVKAPVPDRFLFDIKKIKAPESI
jgi:hypothetical protein